MSDKETSEQPENNERKVLPPPMPGLIIHIEQRNVETESKKKKALFDISLMHTQPADVDDDVNIPDDDPLRRKCEMKVKVKGMERVEDQGETRDEVNNETAVLPNNSTPQLSGEPFMVLGPPLSTMVLKMSRKRGPSYTKEEKVFLLDLIGQFKHVVDNKNTGPMISRLKKQIWRAVTAEYNNKCTSGPRNMEQLQTLYDKITQKSRKCVTGQSNVQTVDTAGDQKPSIIPDDVQSKSCGTAIDRPVVITAKSATGNGIDVVYSAFPTSSPVSNSSDGSVDAAPAVQNQNCTQVAPKALAPSVKKIKPAAGQQKGTLQAAKSSPAALRPQALASRKVHRSLETLKRLYFKRKCRNADIEHDKYMLELLYMKQVHRVKMQTLKNKLNSSFPLIPPQQ